MFWGITLDVAKRYTQTVEKSFHLSMAALGFTNTNTDPVTVMVEVEKAQFALCTLQPGRIPQQPLDIAFTEGEEVTFFTEGNNEVHLTGYLVEEPEAVDIDEMEEFSLDSDETASESESDQSNSKSEGEEEQESLDYQVTLQNLLVGENIGDDDELSDDDWDPTKDNPSPKIKCKDTKKSSKQKKKVENEESNGKNAASNGVDQPNDLASLLFSDDLPSSEDEREDYVPNKKKKGQPTIKIVSLKKKGKKRKIKESNKTEDSSPKNEAEKSKKAKKRTPKPDIE